jgi:hypothetical protein
MISRVVVRRFLVWVVGFSMLCLSHITDIESSHDHLRRWRCGRIIVQDGKLIRVEHRLMCGSASMAQVWWQMKYGRTDDDLVWLDYHQPIGMPAFLTLDYIRSGKRAGYRSFIAAIHLLNEIARIRGSQAIVAHVSNGKISDRLLERQGWQRHMPQWNGRHWIRRFYDGYPASMLHRYV